MSPPWLTSATMRVGLQPAIQRDRARRPAGRLQPLHASRPPAHTQCRPRRRPAATMPQASAPCARAPADRPPTTMRASVRRRRRRAHASIIGARPQRVRPVLDDLAVELLPRRAACRHSAPTTASRNAGARCAALACVDGARHRGARIGEQPLHQRDRPRRRGDRAGAAAARAAGRIAACRRSSSACATSPVRRTRRRRIAARAGCPGSSAENTCATAPFGHSSRRRDGIQCGRSPRGAMRAGCRTGLRSSPRARRARSRRPARCGHAARSA